MTFSSRLVALQLTVVASLLAISIAPALLPFVSELMSYSVVWILGGGLVAALACSIVLARLRCPGSAKEVLRAEVRRERVVNNICRPLISCGAKP